MPLPHSPDRLAQIITAGAEFDERLEFIGRDRSLDTWRRDNAIANARQACDRKLPDLDANAWRGILRSAQAALESLAEHSQDQDATNDFFAAADAAKSGADLVREHALAEEPELPLFDAYARQDWAA